VGLSQAPRKKAVFGPRGGVISSGRGASQVGLSLLESCEGRQHAADLKTDLVVFRLEGETALEVPKGSLEVADSHRRRRDSLMAPEVIGVEGELGPKRGHSSLVIVESPVQDAQAV